MPQHGKKYENALKGFDRETVYPPAEAVQHVKNGAKAKFDETVELSMRLGVDPRKADQIVRGTVTLPGGTGKDVRVAVFASGPAAEEARQAGADIVGAEDLVERVVGGFVDFDVAIATPDLMGQVGKAARVLGPRKLMPNPKTGTVTTDVAKTVGEFKGGKVEYRTDKVGNIHVPIGKASFPPKAILDNFRAVVDEVQRAKPASAKGRYIKSVTVSSTMGPGVRVDTGRLRVTEEDLASEAAAAAAAAPAE
jgi:large subunit ribosomal protein L1